VVTVPRPGPVSLATGSRVCVLLGLLLLIVAAYLYWVPIGTTPLSDGFPARCGSAANPPSQALGRAVCGVANDVRRSQALAAVGGAVVLIVLGPLLFGVWRRDDRSSSAG
jgi:hypothetical protein